MKITCCRCGSLDSPNRKAKGQFVREFNNLENIAAFIVREGYKLYYPNIKYELTNKERFILGRKISSIKNKRRDKE